MHKWRHSAEEWDLQVKGKTTMVVLMEVLMMMMKMMMMKMMMMIDDDYYDAEGDDDDDAARAFPAVLSSTMGRSVRIACATFGARKPPE